MGAAMGGKMTETVIFETNKQNFTDEGVTSLVRLNGVEFVRLDKATELIDRLERVIQKLQWSGSMVDCPYCKTTNIMGHTDGCELGQSLAGVKEWRSGC